MRMNAYYYSFTPTGVEAIDRILSAVACAGKAFHHTEDWSDPVYDVDGATGAKKPEPFEPFLRGWTPVEWIQGAADDAANAFRAMTSQAPVTAPASDVAQSGPGAGTHES